MTMHAGPTTTAEPRTTASPRSAAREKPKPSRLTLAPAQSPLEREADAMADRVMRASGGFSEPVVPWSVSAGAVQLHRKCAECEEEDNKTMAGRRNPDEADEAVFAKRAGPGPEIGPREESRIRSLGDGEALPDSERGFFEPRFGRDFSAVRIHRDASADASARELNAHAYTYRHHIVFAAERYAPGTVEGRRLMAHELAHVVQQGAGAAAAVQRELATPEPEQAPAAQPDLTAAQIREAINFNRARFNERSTREIQDLVGTEQTGVWSQDDVVAVANIQERYGMTKDGKVGPGTFRFLDRELDAEQVDTSDENCLTSLAIDLDAQNVQQVNGTDLAMTRHFTMDALFPSHCDCSHFQYRQFIRGHLTRTRGGVATDLGAFFNDLPLRRINEAFQEDGARSVASVNFGHRDRGSERDNRYVNEAGRVDQANGCRFRGFDTPGGTLLQNQVGDVVDLAVHFRGEIRRDGTAVQTKFWNGPVTNTTIT